MPSIYELTDDFLNGIENELLIDEETGEILDGEALAKALDDIQMEIYQKIDNSACYAKNKRANAEAMKAEAKRLMERAKKEENKADAVENWIGINLSKLGEKKLETARNCISSRRSESVEVYDEKLVPTDFIEYKPSIKKADIKKAIKSGEEVAGARIIQKTSWSFK